MIKKITLKGFASFEEASVNLGKINILIGANGAGKSNLLSFLKMMNFAMTGGLQSYILKRGGASLILHHGPKRTQRISGCLELETENGLDDYQMELAYGANDTLFFADEKIRYTPNGASEFGSYRSLNQGGIRESALNDDSLILSYKTAQVIRALLRKIRVYQFHDTSDSSKIKQNGYIGDNKYLRDDAGNLAAFLFALRNSDIRSYELIRDTIRIVAPFFDDFVLEPMAFNSERIKLEWKSAYDDTIMSASQLSDGTLRFMALTTVFKQPNLPDVICIDEPELGLHPLAINTLIDMVYEVSQSTQVILSTQSVPLVDAVNSEDVLIVEHSQGATTIIKPESELLQEWLEDYKMSEIWERNIIGGRPKQ